MRDTILLATIPIETPPDLKQDEEGRPDVKTYAQEIYASRAGMVTPIQARNISGGSNPSLTSDEVSGIEFSPGTQSGKSRNISGGSVPSFSSDEAPGTESSPGTQSGKSFDPNEELQNPGTVSSAGDQTLLSFRKSKRLPKTLSDELTDTVSINSWKQLSTNIP